MIDISTKAAFEVIFDDYGKDILRYAGFKTSDPAVAEDIAAATFLKYWEKASAGDAITNPRAFLYMVAHGLVVDHYRASSRHQSTPLEEDAELTTSEGDIDVEGLDSKKAYEDILSKLETLKPEYHHVILLHYVEGLTITEVAGILGETENNVRVRLHRGLTKLRKQFAYEQ